MVRIADDDMEHEPVDERLYRLSLMQPSFDNLPECDWIPPESNEE